MKYVKTKLSQKEINKGVKAFQEFRKANRKNPLFYSDTITNEQVAIYALWLVKAVAKEVRK